MVLIAPKITINLMLMLGLSKKFPLKTKHVLNHFRVLHFVHMILVCKHVNKTIALIVTYENLSYGYRAPFIIH